MHVTPSVLYLNMQVDTPKCVAVSWKTTIVHVPVST